MIEVIEPILACPSAIAAMTVKQLAVATIAMQGAAAGMGYIGRRQAADKQQAYQDHLADMQREAAQRRVASLQTKTIQEQAASVRKIEAARQESARVAAQARLSAEAGGVAGLSMEHIIQTHEAQEGRYVAALQEEQKMREANSERMGQDMMLAAGQQMAATQAPISQPSLLAAGLDFGVNATNTLIKSGLFKEDPGSKKSQLSRNAYKLPGGSFYDEDI